MWIPALARAIAVRTVDREFTAPFPIRRWGRPRAAVIVVPLVSVVVIYLTAYGASALFGIARTTPRWQGAGQIATNLVVNLLLGSAIGLLGGMGEELGWRGYLQPRLDQRRVMPLARYGRPHGFTRSTTSSRKRSFRERWAPATS